MSQNRKKGLLEKLRLEDETLRNKLAGAGERVVGQKTVENKAGTSAQKTSKERKLGLGTKEKKEPKYKIEIEDALDVLKSEVEGKGKTPAGPRNVRTLHVPAPKRAYDSDSRPASDTGNKSKNLKKFFGGGSSGDKDDMKLEDYESPPPSPKKEKR